MAQRGGAAMRCRLPGKRPKLPKTTERELAEFVRERRVEIDLNDVSMLNLQGTAHVILVCEGSKTAKIIKDALQRLYPSKDRAEWVLVIAKNEWCGLQVEHAIPLQYVSSFVEQFHETAVPAPAGGMEHCVHLAFDPPLEHHLV
jgi:hypothetical protein